MTKPLADNNTGPPRPPLGGEAGEASDDRHGDAARIGPTIAPTAAQSNTPHYAAYTRSMTTASGTTCSPGRQQGGYQLWCSMATPADHSRA
ncbi:hypothetical protein FOMPIDRAFT_1054663 [Fomitopsis schrenkii]|uniref:Uncharacterized protein n=1 Tax=Fomitopsis schrenkii TaxID=2126942 RepID=S8DNF7_FOMSC|nr:hypothetical protein FOMPIDRAFT_1054663 [Fomitopsis schrenkii]